MRYLNSLRGIDFRDLDFSEAGAWPLPLKCLCFALAAALGLFVAYAGVLSYQRAELAAGAYREQVLRRELAAKRPQAALLPALRAQRQQAAATLAAMLRQLPAQAELPSLIEDISRAALGSDLAIDRAELVPLSARPASADRSLYVDVPISIVVRGGYHQIGAFAAAVAALPRLVTLHDFELAAAEGVNELTLSITAKTYRHLHNAQGDSQ